MPEADTNSLSQKVYGFQRGVVIKNSDPEGRGRVKIFLPSLAKQVINSMTDKQDGEKQWCFKYLGDKVLSDKPEDVASTSDAATKIPDEYMHTLAGVLDWVEQASPLVGGGGIANYDAGRKTAHTSDSPYPTTDGKAGQKPAMMPTRAGAINAISSGSGNKQAEHAGNVDPHVHNQARPSYSNAAKGMFSVPNVGAHVWVFFEGGDVTRPVYFAYSYTGEEWTSVQKQNPCNPDLHSPPMKANDPAGGTDLHTGKTVLNERGGCVEIVNTTDFESVRIGDYNGNHMNMDKFGITRSTALGKNMKEEVNGDYFLDVKGNYTMRIQGNKQTILQGYDQTVNGNLQDTQYQQQWMEAASPVMKNSSRRAALPNFQPMQQEIHESSTKAAPNSRFSYPKDLAFDDKIRTCDPIEKLNIKKIK
jgi:hypothetical protein